MNHGQNVSSSNNPKPMLEQRYHMKTCIYKQWNSIYGKPYFVKCDGGPSYRDNFKQECKAMGIVVKTSSSYNSQSQGLIERQVGIFKADHPIAGIGMWMLEI